MIRGTTAQFKFKLPYTKDELLWIRVKFWQQNNPSKLLPITKTKDHCVCADDNNEIYVSLTSEETARFSDKYKAVMQLRAQPIDGALFGTKERYITVYPMRDDIIDEDIPLDPSITTMDGWVVLDGNRIIG